MFCPSCGTENRDDANFCASCGERYPTTRTRARRERDFGHGAYQTPSLSQMPHVPNYLVQAILVTIFCCLPVGVVSIVYAAQVNGKLAAGDLAGAQQYSSNAKTWAWVSFGIGLGMGLMTLFAMVIALPS